MSFLSRFSFGVAFGILLASVAWVNAEDKYGEELKLDHFKFYKVEPVDLRASVSLRGQFDKDSVPARVPGIIRFANPVSKDGARIIDPQAHLTWYKLDQRLKEPKRAVEFVNQFGKQEILIGQPVALLVPTEKVEKGSKFPERLDHYKVYPVLESRPVRRQVTLKDQFGVEEGVRVGKTAFFAVPVIKKHDDKVYKINNEKGHLTIYEFRSEKPYKLIKQTVDQFGKHRLSITASHRLALPTVKIAWKAIED